MITVETEAEQRGDITLVRGTVTNPFGTPQLVTLESQLEPTWPPRRNGTTAPEWDGAEWTGRLEPDETRAIGFASSATPSADPITVVETTRSTGKQEAVTTNEVLTSLEDWLPARTTVTQND